MHSAELEQISSTINDAINSDKFPEAASLFIDLYVDTFQRYKYAIKLVSDEARYVLWLQQIAFLLDTQDPSERSATALIEFAAKYKLATKTRVMSLLNLWVSGGYLVTEDLEYDRRLKLYKPTHLYEQFVIDSARYFSEPIQLLSSSEPTYHTEAETKKIGHLCRVSAGIYLEVRRYIPLIRGLAHFSMKDGGFELLMRILQEAQFFSEEPRQSITLPFSTIANEFSISRSQVQKLMKSAEQAGLVRVLDDGGRKVELLPAIGPLAVETIANYFGTTIHARRKIIATEQAKPTKRKFSMLGPKR